MSPDRDAFFCAPGVLVSRQLEQLYRLQDRIRFVKNREKERDTVPDELADVDKGYREKVEAADRLRARLKQAQAELARAEAELAEHQEKQKKFQATLRNVQSSREYGAVLNEIDGAEKIVHATEERVLALEEEIEAAKRDLETREASLPKETEEHEQTLSGWRATQRAIDQELEAARAEIRDIEAATPPRERAEFHRLLDKKAGLAIVKVVNASCSACHMKVRPHALQTLKVGLETITCDRCKRILYWEP
ncbi:MAG: zinc ribbon domain-containing protein [Thermoanaerobaculia bacterium]